MRLRGSYRGCMTRTDLHRLVDELPDEAVESAARMLQHAADPMVLTLAGAPVDDEPETAREHAAAAEAWRGHLRGESVSLARVEGVDER